MRMSTALSRELMSDAARRSYRTYDSLVRCHGWVHHLSDYRRVQVLAQMWHQRWSFRFTNMGWHSCQWRMTSALRLINGLKNPERPRDSSTPVGGCCAIFGIQSRNGGMWKVWWPLRGLVLVVLCKVQLRLWYFRCGQVRCHAVEQGSYMMKACRVVALTVSIEGQCVSWCVFMWVLLAIVLCVRIVKCMALGTLRVILESTRTRLQKMFRKIPFWFHIRLHRCEQSVCQLLNWDRLCVLVVD